MLLLIYTFSLSIGAWYKWEQYIMVIIPIILAIFIKLFISNSKYILSTCCIATLLLAYEIRKSTRLKNLLIKVDPKIIMRFSAKSLLLLFCILGGIISLIDPDMKKSFDLGERVAELSGKHVEKYLDKQISEQILEQDYDVIEDGGTVVSEGYEIPAKAEIYDGFYIDLRELYEDKEPTQEQLKSFISRKVNEATEQYKEFFQPILSLVTFSVLQIYALIAFFLYGLTIDLIFWTAKRLKLVHIHTENVEKENLIF